jgi:hypothetical protein
MLAPAEVRAVISESQEASRARKRNMTRLVLVLLISLVVLGGVLRTFNLGSRGYFIPDEDISIKTGNYFVLGNATGFGLKFTNESLDIFWPHPYNYEHPPLGKILIGYSGLLFGHTPSGYRLLGAILGTALIPLVFFIARKFMGGLWALVPAAVVAIDPLLVQLSRVATPDTYFLFFAVSAFAALLLLNGKTAFVMTGVFAGLSIASKWLGFYALLALLLYQFLSNTSLIRRVAKPVGTAAIAAAVYVASYIEYFVGGPVYQIGSPAPSYLLLGPHSLADFSKLQLWMINFNSYWHVAGTQYSYVFLSPLTYVLPGVPSAPVYAFDVALFSAIPLAVLAYFSRTYPPSLLVLWSLSGLIPLFNQGFVWYLALEIPGAAMLITWFAFRFQTNTWAVKVIPPALILAEALLFLSFTPL